MTDVSTDQEGVNGSLWTGVLLIVLGVGRCCACGLDNRAETWIALILISAELLVYAFQTRSSEASSGSCC